MKKLAKSLVLLLSVTALAFIVTACGGKSKPKPTVNPSVSTAVSSTPTATATPTPAVTPTPSVVHSVVPSVTLSVTPSVESSVAPSVMPTETPTAQPTVPPSVAPSVAPSATPSIAPSVSPSDTWLTVFTVNGTGETITGLTAQGRNLSRIEIPTEINGVEIKGIDDSAFSNCTNLTEIVLPDSITSIGDLVFSNCTSLTEIVIPKNVSDIGVLVFAHCNSLTNISVDANNEKYKTVDGDLYSKDGTTLIQYASGKAAASVAIPDGVNTIFAGAFYDCESLTTITFGQDSQIAKIGSAAFYSCDSLTEITIPDSVAAIGDYAFMHCNSLTVYCEAAEANSEWSVEWNVSSIPVVWNCNDNDVATDSNIYTLQNGVRYALREGCATVVMQPKNIGGGITLPESVLYKGNSYAVTTIGEQAFSSCGLLTDVVIPNSVTSIEKWAFSNGDSLTEIVIPASVINMGERAFAYCTSLTIYCEAAEKPAGWADDWNKSTLAVVWDSLNNKAGADGSFYATVNGIRYALKEGVATVVKQPQTLSGEIHIPASVSYLGESYAVKKIVSDAFSDCNSLTKVTFDTNSQITAVGDYAFASCDSLVEIVLPGGITAVGSNAFAHCRALTKVVIPSSVIAIGKYAFYDCDFLTIYCEAESKPSGWNGSWNGSRPVVWGYTGE